MKRILLVVTFAFALAGLSQAQTKILNVSYDVSRAFYKEYNPLFAAQWKSKSGKDIAIEQSHAGSSKQARAVVDGLPADVVTFNQDTDIDLLVDRGLVNQDWKSRLPYGSSPYSSVILFLVRAGNPKGIKDWDDLVKPGVQVIVPNPKTSGNGRYSYLAAWAYALKKNNGDQAAAKDFVAKLFKNVPVLDTGGRAATTTFAQNGIGDVLLTFESEVFAIKADPTVGVSKLDSVVPSLSIVADAPVAVVDKNVDKAGTRAAAEDYLKYLFSPEGQELAAKNYFRPRDPAVLAKHKSEFPELPLVSVDETFGDWKKAQAEHFSDGALFDQIYIAN
ncbi:MAG TPA: sulfate ABC transporter substrate-binding protein [Chthoniobacterales bacterium]